MASIMLVFLLSLLWFFGVPADTIWYGVSCLNKFICLFRTFVGFAIPSYFTSRNLNHETTTNEIRSCLQYWLLVGAFMPIMSVLIGPLYVWAILAFQTWLLIVLFIKKDPKTVVEIVAAISAFIAFVPFVPKFHRGNDECKLFISQNSTYFEFASVCFCSITTNE